MKFARVLALGALLSSAGLVACGSDSTASGSPASSGAPTAKATATAAAATAAPEKGGAATTGEIETHDKKKVGYSITLPEGLKDVSESPHTKEYAKEKGKFDGYSFVVIAPEGPRAQATLDQMVTEAEKAKVKILTKGSLPNGWYVVASLDEGGKKGILAQCAAWKGDVRLEVKGSLEGPLAADTAAGSEALIKTCKSFTVTSP